MKHSQGAVDEADAASAADSLLPSPQCPPSRSASAALSSDGVAWHTEQKTKLGVSTCRACRRSNTYSVRSTHTLQAVLVVSIWKARTCISLPSCIASRPSLPRSKIRAKRAASSKKKKRKRQDGHDFSCHAPRLLIHKKKAKEDRADTAGDIESGKRRIQMSESM